MKKNTVLVWVIGIVSAGMVIFTAAGIAAGNFFYNLAINPKTDKSVVFDAPSNSEGSRSGEKEDTLQRDQEWFFRNEYTERYIQSFDNLTLHAYELTHRDDSKKWAVLCHGYTSDALRMVTQGRQFYAMGYNLLLPDARGHGKSGGDYIGMGWPDRKDVTAWINTLVEEHGAIQIAVYGVSMGGATVMMVSGEELPPQVKAIVEDCGYTSAWDVFAYQLKTIFGLPAFPVMNFSSMVTKIRAGYTLEEASALEQVRKTSVPIMFIHGDADTFVPFYMLDEVYDAASSPKRRLVVPGAAHGMAAIVMGDAYWTEVGDFLGNYIED
ncbi:alpha/beta hydrolase [Breznakiella homolactica]|uniref:Alpha/beta hydrolase n=1 Tax=Breznakiella homolactica TaxID=2798577 RepID=A0A7T7XLJ4_9SPIR|nr:alpha/beta hydrolase [Breznakiella homolactica]QQO08468.1 alpha/beta hydrolase [Breznakiella homolactica]